jgi:protease I
MFLVYRYDEKNEIYLIYKKDACMMNSLLIGCKVAILSTTGFQQVEMTSPREALQKAGAIVHLIAPDQGVVHGWDCDIPKVLEQFPVDVPLEVASADDYDALIIPGGYASPEELRLNQHAIQFVQGFAHKPIAAICHGPALLINAKLVKNRTVTSYPAIQIDLMHAGATWIDQAVVIDGTLITSRSPEDLSLFNKAVIEICARTYKKRNIE